MTRAFYHSSQRPPNGAYAMAVWMAGTSGGKDDDDPCPDIQKKISDTIQGVGMPGNKSLLTRVVEQIVGEGGKVYADHEKQIESYRNRLKNLRRDWDDNDCGDPPSAVNNWIQCN